MPILPLLVVAAACSPVPWPDPFDLGIRSSLILVAAIVLIPVLLTALLSGWVVRALKRDPEARQAIQLRYGKLRHRLSLLNLVLAALAIGGGWGAAVWSIFRVDLGDTGVRLAPGAELLVPAPYFLMLFAGWIAGFFAERALHRTRSHNDEAFWSLPAYLLFYCRQFTLIILLPVLLFVTHQSLTRTLPTVVVTDWFQGLSVFGGLALFVLLPRFVKPLLGLQTLPKGPVRDRLEATARRLRFRTADLLIWSTNGAVANAMIVGVIPWARYVIFTDRLVKGMTPEELDAVFGHEAGHSRHHHIPYYAVFFLLSASVATAGFALLERELGVMGWTFSKEASDWMALPMLAVMGVYIFLVFGLLSRRCERQADVDGCRAGSCFNPRCFGHDDETVLAPIGTTLCRTGVISLIRALDRVAQLNGLDGLTPRTPPSFAKRFGALVKAWQHGPVPNRIEFLLRLSDDPTLGVRHDRRVARFRLGLMAVLIAVFGVFGSLIGWAQLWKMM